MIHTLKFTCQTCYNDYEIALTDKQIRELRQTTGDIVLQSKLQREENRRLLDPVTKYHEELKV